MEAAEFLKKIRSIEIASRRLVKSGMAGQYLSAFRGSGMQFREFRNYVYGDDVRHISWNVSARTTEPVLKLFEEEREKTLFLVIDVSASLRRGPWAEKKAERLAEIAGCLAVSAHEVGDKLGVLLFSDRIEKVIPPAKGRTHLLRIIRDVLKFEPQGVKTNPDIALNQLDLFLKKQAVVFLLSDMEILPSEKIMRQTRSAHDFIAVSVEHPGEWKIPQVGFIELQTAELKRPVTLDTTSGTVSQYMKAHAKTRADMIHEHFQRSAIDLLWTRTDEDFVPLLRNFFSARSKRRGSA